MTDLSRIYSLKYGKHSSTTDFTATPGTLVQLEPQNMPSFISPEREKLTRESYNSAGRYLPSIVGRKMLDTYNLELLLRGMNGNTGAAVDAEAASEIGSMLDSLTGTDSVDPAGASTTIAGGSGATPSLQVADGTNIAVGDGVLFPTSVGTYAREVVAKPSADVCTLDRQYSGTPVNGTVVYRSCHWAVNPLIHEHKHLYFRAEHESGRRDFFGCMGTASISFAMNQIVKLISTWKATDITDDTDADPTFTAPTVGGHIIAINSLLYIGDDAWTFRDINLTLGGQAVARACQNGTNGILGYSVQDKMPMFTGKFYKGTTSGLGEIADSSGNLSINKLQAWDKSAGQSMATYDLGLQVGASPGACLYVRAPSLGWTKATPSVTDGLDTIDVEGTCFSPSSGGSLRLHIF